MKLDAAAVHALHLLPVNELIKEDTIYGILCRARTPGGQRMLSEWIKQPLIDPKKIGIYRPRCHSERIQRKIVDFIEVVKCFLSLTKQPS